MVNCNRKEEEHDDVVSCVVDPAFVIPTYPLGEPDKNPLFLEKRIYQGSIGVVYPYPVIDRIVAGNEPENRTYQAIFLENRYLKIMILPELGGRVQMALDKTNNYHFCYYNQVIKPALVGLAGPWISGGIEFNWPQHHRPTTFSPLDWKVEENEENGSKTVWCSEIEPMFRTKGMHGFTLSPNSAFLEVQVQLYNRTSVPQTFLWWANPAVHVNDEYQSVFPPDVHAVMDHGKRDVSDFPIATGTYYKKDYAPGTDISRYNNIPVPTSYMAYHSEFDFVGCYDHGKEAGMMHVANHHIVPGKKQWTWGNGDFGQAWDRQLTDHDGPYIELMCGAYTDNQPDFSWIQPGEEKSFTQIFMPYKHVGPAQNASKEAVIHLDIRNPHGKDQGAEAEIGVYVTRPRRVRVVLEHNEHHGTDLCILFEKIVDLNPETTLKEIVKLGSTSSPPQSYTLRVFASAEGQLTNDMEEEELISFTPLPNEARYIPSPATAALPPSDIQSIEELYLNGLHLEQYRHATFAPESYYEEALHRDPGDSRCNNALGLLLYRRGKFAEAEPYFRRSIARLTMRNPNPYDGEPYYNLGLSLTMQYKYKEAFDSFYKATWNAAWQAPAFFELAKLASRVGKTHKEALSLVERCLAVNGPHHKARHLQIALLRRVGREQEALALIEKSMALDACEYGACCEQQYFFQKQDGFFADQSRNGNRGAAVAIELALDYFHSGILDDAIELLGASSRTSDDPMVQYTLGWILEQAGNTNDALEAFQIAATLSPDYCFPNRLEDVLSLTCAMECCPHDARAPYYLGNFWYAHRQCEEAINCWEKSRDLDEQFATVHRNLGLAYYNKIGDSEKALKSFETAFDLDTTDARVLFELDQLCKKQNHNPQTRLQLLENHSSLVDQRDDLTIELISLLNILRRPNDAFEILSKRCFHPWEGGEGKVTGQYVTCLVEMAKTLTNQGEFLAAVEKLEHAQVYPHNLGEGKLYGAQENNIFYYMGMAFNGLGQHEKAQECWKRAATGLSEPSSAMFYNDQPPDMIFYQGLALQQLGRKEEARQVFDRLVQYGQSHLQEKTTMDYFAVSLPTFLVFDEDLDRQNQIHCNYMIALGFTGLGLSEEAKLHFGNVLELDRCHLGSILHQPLAATPTQL